MEEKILKIKETKFRLLPQENLGDEELICETRCPYSDICDKLPNPRNPEDPDSSFEDFCGELGELGEPGQNEEDPDRAEIFNSIPAPGSLETIYPEYFKK